MASIGNVCTGADQHARGDARIQYYATWTGTRANLAAMHAAGMGVLCGPGQLDRRGIPPLAWACDNGAWTAHTQGEAWDPGAFREVVSRWGAGAQWIVVPDIVAAGMESLRLSESWLPELAGVAPLLIPVQDGMSPDDVRPLLGDRVGLFVGGSTAWKWGTLERWAELARDLGTHIHVGRVGSARRIRRCVDLGIDSVDGTGPTRWSAVTPRLDRACRSDPHLDLFGGAA